MNLLSDIASLEARFASAAAGVHAYGAREARDAEFAAITNARDELNRMLGRVSIRLDMEKQLLDRQTSNPDDPGVAQNEERRVGSGARVVSSAPASMLADGSNIQWEVARLRDDMDVLRECLADRTLYRRRTKRSSFSSFCPGIENGGPIVTEQEFLATRHRRRFAATLRDAPFVVGVHACNVFRHPLLFGIVEKFLGFDVPSRGMALCDELLGTLPRHKGLTIASERLAIVSRDIFDGSLKSASWLDAFESDLFFPWTEELFVKASHCRYWEGGKKHSGCRYGVRCGNVHCLKTTRNSTKSEFISIIRSVWRMAERAHTPAPKLVRQMRLLVRRCVIDLEKVIHPTDNPDRVSTVLASFKLGLSNLLE